MARIADLISRDGAHDGLGGVGANVWYAEVAAPAPTSPTSSLYVTIPDISMFGPETKFGPVRWGGRLVPNLGDSVLVAFDNRQQMWALLGIADSSTAVNSVFGRTGAVVKQTGDYAVADITGAESSAHATATYAPITTTPKFTASAISGGPPASPNNGDIWIATGVDANGTVWQFRYNSGSASAYKWEFIGGAPITAGVLGSMTIAATGETNLTGGPTITTARSGDYILGVGCTVNAAAAQYLTVHPKGSVSGNIGPTITWSPPAAFYEVGWQETIVTGLAAQTFNITCAIANGTVGTGFQSGIIKITPIRIS